MLFKCFSIPSDLTILDEWIVKEELKEFLAVEEISFIEDKTVSLSLDIKDVNNFKINGNFTKLLPSIVQKAVYLIKVCSWAFKRNNNFGEFKLLLEEVI